MVFDKLLENDYNNDEQVTLNRTEKYMTDEPNDVIRTYRQ